MRRFALKTSPDLFLQRMAEDDDKESVYRDPYDASPPQGMCSHQY